MKYQSECGCLCHKEEVFMHFGPCCQPDPVSTNDAREALRECPFCGGKAMRKDDPGVIGEMFGLVVDHVPGCFLTLRGIETNEVFDAAWNKRACLPAPAVDSTLATELEALAKGKIEKCLSPLSARGKVYDIGYATGLMRAAILVLESITAPQPPATGGDAVEVEKIVAWLRRGGLHAIADQIELGDHRTAVEKGNS